MAEPTAVPHAASTSTSFESSSKSSIANLITWIFAVCTIVTVIFVLSHKLYQQRRKWPQVNELLLIVTAIFEFVQASASAWQSNQGVGKDRHGMPEADLHDLQKSVYCRAFFYLLIITFAKLSTLRNLYELTPQKQHRFLIHCIEVFVGVSALASILSLAFQCSLPHPWDIVNGKCINRGALSIFIVTWDILSDVAMVGLPFLILRTLHISRTETYYCLVAYSVRFLCVPVSLFHAVYAVRYDNSSNFPQAAFAVAIAGNTQFLITILAAAFPHVELLDQPLRKAYLAAITQQPDKPLRISWPFFPGESKKDLKTYQTQTSRSDVDSIWGANAVTTENIGLTPYGSTMGRASRNSGSSEEESRVPSRLTDGTEPHVEQTKEYHVRAARAPKK